MHTSKRKKVQDVLTSVRVGKALGILTAIHRALDLAGEEAGGPPMHMQDVPTEDPATYEMICKADTVGNGIEGLEPLAWQASIWQPRDQG